ncbi:MAG: glycosyltransferase [Calothrix sp. FI2-JRJ7]|jgi:cellulose synthase/poly-beta-1,6-N-acetylglucosamine synthase-like glycosyltransferase|nr:glycosyltransferase [Calothrix sp. FI2-JRJ7]
MNTIAYLCLGTYLILLVISALSSWLLVPTVITHRKHSEQQKPQAPLVKFPKVTIQLPIFNEYYVSARLLNALKLLNYPKDCFDIQILDDSTDETSDLLAVKTIELKQEGFSVSHIRRSMREGFKSGALQHGMQISNSDFFAIFDADFMPDPDFLVKVMPYFQNEQVAIVQTKLHFANWDTSFLTRIQQMQTSLEFEIDIPRRAGLGSFLQFNGTGGVLRRSSIQQAGGWQGDTLAEDLDLTTRLYLKGWQVVYAPEVISTGEFPIDVISLCSQQFRWVKGTTEVFRKLGDQVFNSALPPNTKDDWVSLCLFYNSMFPIFFATGILSITVTLLNNYLPPSLVYWSSWLYLFWIVPMLITYTYAINLGKEKHNWWKNCGDFLFFLFYTLAFSWQNSIAVFQGGLGWRSEFKRTPKLANTKPQERKKYLNFKWDGMLLSEVFLGGIYAIMTIIDSLEKLPLLFIHILLAASFIGKLVYTLYFRLSISNWLIPIIRRNSKIRTPV